MLFSLENINKDWTLFLDRDGVINVRPYQDYVKKPSDFQFLPGVIEAISILRKDFKYLIIITNQQGIGKRLMTAQDLFAIHHKMQLELEHQGGKIDAIYYCQMLADEKNNCRKPEPFMALKAKEDFPDIEFAQSIMAGDTSSDIVFGQNLGMKTIQIGNNQLDIKANFLIPDLLSFAKTLDQKQQPDVA